MALGALVALILLMAYGVRGCAKPPETATQGSVYVPPGMGTGPTTASGLMDIPVVMTDSVCRLAFDGSIRPKLSPEGTSLLVSGIFQRGSRKYQGFNVYDLTGKPLWDHLFANSSYRSAEAWYLAGGRYIGAVANDYDGDGEVIVLDSRGRFVFSREVRGWIHPIMSDDGSWLALLNIRRRELQVFGPPRLAPAWSLRTGPGATGFFLGNGPDFLLYEAGRARLYDREGKIVWSKDIPDGGRWNVASSPDGKYLAVTTEDPDSTVYLYTAADGSLVWSQFLVAGGTKRLAWSPDGASLVVYDVGQRAAIYLINAGSGEIRWRFYLTGRENSSATPPAAEKQPTTFAINDLKFTPSGRNLVADVYEASEGETSYTFYHYLLLLSPDGRALWVSPLGSLVDVDVNATAGLVLLATNNLMDIYGDIRNTVTLVSFVADITASAAGGGK